ncbi:complex I intermediate-associated protein 30, mitochondrial [Culicoides brevitarsis]|uniref:complex I intermediate-associated protein 30, mitochondrial n=1 Tax=Culicoides brevitarsis TaxID=469753 RepID=UPI00307BEB11
MASTIFQRALPRLLSHSRRETWKTFNTTAVNYDVWERSRKGTQYEQHTADRLSRKDHILNGLKMLKSEIKLWQEEVKEHLTMDPILAYRPGEVDIAYQFTTKEEIEKWVVTADSDHGQGFSSAAFDLSPAGYGLFHGNVRSDVPKDGRIKRAGYCNVKSPKAMKSFKREIYLDWQPYNTLILKIRGDGRNYLINIHTDGYFDILWNDIYHYVLYTRGGPHWQIAKIPFSKFFLSSKGRIQDKQAPIPLNKITSVSFSVGAKGDSDGPFNLEIDYIGLEFDPNHVEKFAYEMYKMPKYIVGV